MTVARLIAATLSSMPKPGSLLPGFFTSAGSLLLGFFISAFAFAADDPWPGAPPDCWSEDRNVHSGSEGQQWEKQTRIGVHAGERPKPGEMSPNQGYWFVRQGDWPTARILVHAEKAQLTQIEFSGIHALGEVRWINEKLLFIRVWWSRLSGNDLIFDVETESFIASEQFHDGGMARRQFRENCPKIGCACIGKRQ